MEKKTYRSRISVLYVLMFGSLLFLGWYIIKTTGDSVGLIISGIIAVWSIFAFRSIRYVLTEKEIQFHYLWGIRGKIYISAIASIERSYNPFNALAASMKRLHFHFKKGYKWHVYFSNSPFLVIILPSISPVREQEFLETLKIINPNIQINVSDKKGWWRFWDWDI